MLAIKFVRENPELVERAARAKGTDFDVPTALALADEVRRLRTAVDAGHHQKKVLSADFKKAGSDREAARAESVRNAETLKEHREQLAEAESALRDVMLRSPQIPWECSPVGTSEADNVVVDTWGKPPTFDFEPLDHVALLEKRNWANFAGARQVSGERAYMLLGDAVRLERALLSFAIDVMSAREFQLISVPALVREPALVGTGFLPGHGEEIYRLEADDLYLAGTAEVALVGLASTAIHENAELPIRQAGVSPCFRREVGSAGRDVRGLIRVHQFEKVEQFVVCEADENVSAHWHAELLGSATHILQSLELPYEIVECCTGDMGLGKVRMNDINTWFPSLDTYRETHSCSTLHDWQARRANIRYRAADGSIQFAHTLNNTAMATPRLLGAFVENMQQEDHAIRIPAALQAYLGGVQEL